MDLGRLDRRIDSRPMLLIAPRWSARAVALIPAD